MAQKYITQTLDDLDGSEATDTITFALDGKNYAIDLNAEHAREMRDALAQYTDAARVDGKRTVKNAEPKPGKRDDLAAIRDWARNIGYAVNDRGRIAKEIVDAYDAAH